MEALRGSLDPDPSDSSTGTYLGDFSRIVQTQDYRLLAEQLINALEDPNLVLQLSMPGARTAHGDTIVFLSLFSQTALYPSWVDDFIDKVSDGVDKIGGGLNKWLLGATGVAAGVLLVAGGIAGAVAVVYNGAPLCLATGPLEWVHCITLVAQGALAVLIVAGGSGVALIIASATLVEQGAYEMTGGIYDFIDAATIAKDGIYGEAFPIGLGFWGKCYYFWPDIPAIGIYDCWYEIP